MTSKTMHGCLAALLATTLAPLVRDARADEDEGSERMAIRSVSTHADRVTGGDVLVEISLPRGARKGATSSSV